MNSFKSKVWFKHQTFYELNLIQIEADPNYFDHLN